MSWIFMSVASVCIAGSNVSPLDVLYSYSNQYQKPIWVSARELAREPGRIAWEKLADDDRAQIQRGIESQNKYLRESESLGKKMAIPSGFEPKMSSDLCVGSSLRLPPYSGKAAPTTFAGLVSEADGVIEARITAVEPGFFLGLPASLLEVQVTKTYRRLPNHAQTDTYYVYHSFARFALGGNSFCNTLSTKATGPKDSVRTFDAEAGGKVLLFVFGLPLDHGKVLISPLADQVLYESPKGGLALSETLQRDDELHPARSLEEVEALLETALHGSTRPAKPGRPDGPQILPPQGGR